MRVLVVSHSKTGGTKAMTEAVVAGATHPDIDGVEVVQVAALEATADDVMAADGYLLGTPENFGYMSGALKHFFDTVYYDCLDHTRGRPYGLFVRAGNDGTGAVRAVEPLVTGLGWKAVAPPVVATGELTDAHLEACRELGMTLAAGLELGIY